MNIKKIHKPLLNFKFEGPAIRDGRILYEDLSLFVSNIRISIERIINSIQTGESIKRGRPLRKIQLLSSLEIVSMSKGSFQLGLDLRRDEQAFPGMDIGEEAIDKLVLGVKSLATNKPLPEEFDQGVLVSLREAGRVIDRGIDIIRINSKSSFGARRAVYVQDTRSTIIKTIRRYEKEYATIEGRLLEADLKEDKLRCRIESSIGEPTNCKFDEAMAEQIVRLMRNFVQARGEATFEPITNKISLFYIRDLEPIESATGITEALISPFWKSKSFEELATEQDVLPIDDLTRLSGGWPEDEDIEQFLESIRSTRQN
jgi:hypothetical protein